MTSRLPDRSETGLSLDTVSYGVLPPGPDPGADREIDRLVWQSVRANYEGLRGAPDVTAKARDLLEQALLQWVTAGRPAERNENGVHVLQILAAHRFHVATERLSHGEPMFPELDHPSP